jgi:hypothetical protein
VKSNNVHWFAVGLVIGACLIALCWAVFASYASQEFLNVTLMDIVKLVVAAALGAYMANLYSSSLSQWNRRFTLVSSELVILRELFEVANECCKTYMEHPAKQDMYKMVNLKLKRAGNKLYYFSKILEKCEFASTANARPLIGSFGKIRDIVTGTNFASGRSYTPDTIDDVSKRFSGLQDQLDRIMMELS